MMIALHRIGIALAFAVAAVGAAGAEPPSSAPVLTAEQIVERNVAARGGLDAWRKVQTLVWIGHIQSPHGPMPSLPFSLAQKRPNKTRFEINAMGQKTLRLFDGLVGWKVRAKADGSPDLQSFTPQDARFARDGQGIDGPLIDYAAKGSTVMLEAAETVDGHDAYRLNVRLASGQDEHVWVDAQSFLEMKSARTAFGAGGRAVGTVTTFYRDFREFEGLKMPTVIETGVGSGQGTDRMVIERVVINPPLEDKAFTRAAASSHPRGFAHAQQAAPVSGAVAMPPQTGAATESGAAAR